MIAPERSTARRPYALALVAAAMSLGCTDEPAPFLAPYVDRPSEAPVFADRAAYVFDPLAVRHYEVSVDPADWDRIQRFPVKEEYVTGSLLFEGRRYAPVAIRFKGARGSLYNCFDCCSTSDTLARCPTVGCYGPDGMLSRSTCPKLSMKLDFGTAAGKTDFYGVDRINFHASDLDGTHLRERLAYSLFADFGIRTPRTASASLWVNGQELGVFTIVEQVDSAFVEAAFPDDHGEGNVYKARWPTLSTDPAYFRSGLETNRKSGDVSHMVSFAEALRGATRDTVATLLRERMDLRALIRYLAVDRAIRHFDGPLMFRCKDPATIPPLPADILAAQSPPLPWEVCQNKNYYFYEGAVDHRLTLVPWDLDYTLVMGVPWTEWSAPPAACGVQFDGRSPGCDPLVRWLATELYPDYQAAAREFLAGPFRMDRMKAKLDAWAKALAIPLAEREGLPTAIFRSGVQALEASLEGPRAAFEQSLSAGVGR